ncbi:MAG: nitroreductase [Lachnospiraceae bacterium]|nr:nitroreductase [Lachnospiraceae bacterium]
MSDMDVIKERHSVRQYTEKKIEMEKRTELNALADKINSDTRMHIQILYDEPKCFDGIMAHYGNFSNVKNYIALVGPATNGMEEKAGYYGEQLVLKAQEMGLNTCWVALSHGKSAAVIGKGEKLFCLIALGYGVNQGCAHKSKAMEEVCKVTGTMPDWFKKGMEAALLAPTALNQQKFCFTLEGDTVTAKVRGMGFYTKIDLGIVKYHFELTSGVKVL